MPGQKKYRQKSKAKLQDPLNGGQTTQKKESTSNLKDGS